MRGMLRVDPSDGSPIWRQIEDGVRRLALAGTLRPGAPVPSVRELAKELCVNPATVAKAYQRLVDAGVLTVRRGEGTYVAESSPSRQHRERDKALKEGALRYGGLAHSLGARHPEAAAALKEAWAELKSELDGGNS